MAYVTVEDVRAVGVPDPPTDEEVEAKILLWSQLVDRITRQFFEPRDGTYETDGNDSSVMFLPIPIITCTAVYANDDFTTPVSSDRYRVYNSRGPITDDRKNPKISLHGSGDIFTSTPRYRSIFAKGSRNQRVVGTWGYTESDGSTPAAIKHAVLKLVRRDLMAGVGTTPGTPPDPPVGGVVIMEITDGHTIQYANTSPVTGRPGTSACTGDIEVDKILELYKGPIILASPGSNFWSLTPHASYPT